MERRNRKEFQDAAFTRAFEDLIASIFFEISRMPGATGSLADSENFSTILLREKYKDLVWLFYERFKSLEDYARQLENDVQMYAYSRGLMIEGGAKIDCELGDFEERISGAPHDDDYETFFSALTAIRDAHTKLRYEISAEFVGRAVAKAEEEKGQVLMRMRWQAF